MLDTLVIGSGVETIGKSAFLCCFNLTIYGEPGSYVEYYSENILDLDYIAYKNHYCEDEKVTEEPTETTFGKKEGTCIFCGEKVVRDVIETGTNGNLSWRFNKDTGELTVSGEGEYVTCVSDWDFYLGISIFSNTSRRYRIFVKSVIINEGITKIGQYEFIDFCNLESISIPASVTEIEGDIFQYSAKPKNITISKNNKKYRVDENNNIIIVNDSEQTPVENGWYSENGTSFWYENGVKQGTEGRGKEIYDPKSDAWYWLDNVQGGAKAVSKDVYQESQADDAGNMGKWVRYDAEGHMIKGWSTNENGTYYFDKTYGTMLKGIQVIDGQEYYFDEATGIKR